jgi:hypothetical protein
MTEDGYEDEISDLEDLLDGIAIGEPEDNGNADEPIDEPTEEATEAADDTGNTSDLPGVDGNTYTGPQYPVTVTWEDEWDVQSATSDENGDALVLSNGTTNFNLLAGEFEPQPTDCIDQFAAIAAEFDGVDNYEVATNDEGEPQADTTAKAAWSYFAYDLDGEAYFDYIECNAAAGDFVIAIIVQIPAADLPNELPAIQTLLADIALE